MTSGADGNWYREARVLLAKEIRAELRTRTALCALGVFAFSALLLVGLATAGLKDITATNPFTGAVHPAWDSAGKMGMLWILITFAAFSGLSHSFVHEEEAGTVSALRLCCGPSAVYAGKLAFNFLVLLAVTLLMTPIYLFITGMSIGSPFVFILVMAGGCAGIAAAATLVAALSAKVRGTGALFGAIGIPLVLVLLLLLMNAAGTLYTVDAPTLRIVRDVGGLISYDLLLITFSAITFPFVWEE